MAFKILSKFFSHQTVLSKKKLMEDNFWPVKLVIFASALCGNFQRTAKNDC